MHGRTPGGQVQKRQGKQGKDVAAGQHGLKLCRHGCEGKPGGSNHAFGAIPRKQAGTNGTAVHLVGKDILRFHAVYWPAFLLAAAYLVGAIPFGA